MKGRKINVAAFGFHGRSHVVGIASMSWLVVVLGEAH